MARTLPILSAGSAALALAGCGQAEHRASTASDAPAARPSAEPPAPSESAVPEAGATRPSPGPAADECGADKLGDYLNLLPTSDAMAKIRKAIGHDRIRTINPGDMVTMDFRPDRLDIELGVDGRIKRFRCG
jgi:hypothetical protein